MTLHYELLFSQRNHAYFFLRVLSKLLVEVGGANVDIQDAKGKTPAMLAKEMNQSYVMNYLS